MDFRAVIAFLIMYYIRPQEWVGGLESLRPVLVLFIFGIAAMVLRKRGFKPKELVQTPLDWAMLAYLLWLCLSTATQGGNWDDLPGIGARTAGMIWTVKNYFGFYYVVGQSLHNRERIESFLWWWLGMILLVALLGIDALYGLDIMGSAALNNNPRLAGRLVLNNGMYLNPNDLGHTLIPLIPLIYLFCIWRRPPFMKQAALGVMLIPLYVVFMTKSKGAYLSGAFTAMVATVFGRPRFAQIALITLALTVGTSAVSLLPRMTHMKNPREEEGIRGRLAVFYFGYENCKDNTLLGWRNFQRSFNRAYGFSKASHSSYNQIGAELGQVGLFLYLGCFYCGLRLLFTAKITNIRDERIRRVLVAAILAFMASSWIIDFAYHGTFFFILACTSAFHRHLLKQDQNEGEQLTAPRPAPLLEQPSVTEEVDIEEEEANKEKEEPAYAVTWARIGWKDLGICLVALQVVFVFWRYILYTWGT